MRNLDQMDKIAKALAATHQRSIELAIADAYRAGAEGMRERAAKECHHEALACVRDGRPGDDALKRTARAIRAMPVEE